MPVDKSCSLEAFKSNIRREYKAGKRAKGTQHVAIALSILKRACGVPDDFKGGPKDIIAAGGKNEGRFVPLDALTELKGVQKADTKTARRDFVLWLNTLRKASDAASREAMSTSRYVSGKRTQKLQKLVKDGAKRPFPPPGEVKFRLTRDERKKLGEGKPIVTDAKGRPIEKPDPPPKDAPWAAKQAYIRAMNAYNDAVSDAANKGFSKRFRKKVRESRFGDLFERIQHMGSFGPDYTVAMGIHGVGTSPSASTTPERSRYNVQHGPWGIRRGRPPKKGTLGVKANPAGQGTRF